MEELDKVQRTMEFERIGGFKAEPLAARREAALIALTVKHLDGDCREGLRNYAPVLRLHNDRGSNPEMPVFRLNKDPH